MWHSTQPTEAGCVREGSHLSGISWFLWQVKQKKGWLVVNRTMPRAGIAARIRRMATIKAQVRLDSLGMAGIFMPALEVGLKYLFLRLPP
jgi:hypothetical protein